MLLFAIIGIVYCVILQLSTASTYFCSPLSNKTFQWLNADGSLVLPATYAAAEELSWSVSYKKNDTWQFLPDTQSCQYSAASSVLLCRDLQYILPDPTSLPSTSLFVYNLTGGLIHLPARSFSGLAIKYLIIENTNLTFLGEKTFEEVKSIKYLYLRKNNLHHIDNVGNLLQPLHTLRAIYLDYNNLQRLLSYKAADLPALEYVSLKGNTLYNFDVFFLQNSGLKFLDLRFTTFKGSSEGMAVAGLSSLPSNLSSIDLSNAKISVKSLGAMMKQLSKSKVTTLNVSYITSSPWLLHALSFIANSLEQLSLEGTNMARAMSTGEGKDIIKITPFVKLIELNMNKCNISHLQFDIFKAFPNLKILSLADNYLYHLDMTYFVNLSFLNYLDLRFNTFLDVSASYSGTAENVQALDLSSTKIYMNYNSSIHMMNTFPNLQSLSLCNAQVQLSNVIMAIYQQNLTYLDLSATLPYTNNILPYYENLFKSLSSSITNLVFTQNDFKLPPNYTAFFSHLTNLKSLNLSNNLIRDISQDIVQPSLNTIILSQNLITTWYSEMFYFDSHPKYLDLSNNQVTYVSEAMVHDFYKLDCLDLSNNPLICHNKVVAMVCAAVKNETYNLTMISRQKYKCYDIVSNSYRLFSQPQECDDYYEEVSTTHKSWGDLTTRIPQESSSLSLSRLTVYENVNIVITLSLVSLAALCAAVSCIIYFKWWSIRCYMHRYFTLRRARLLRKEVSTIVKPDMHYDVFVSYSDVDRSWILDHLIPSIEAEGDIALCFHERDFQIGLSILENIVECMDRSHAILLVVSSAFVRSKWCQFEMHLAQYRLIETLRDQLVLVLLEDIPKKSRPQVLHHLMMTKTYLVWPSQPNKEDATELFWRRLKRALKPNFHSIFNI